MERAILFNTEMVKAIMDGRKTQTRRVVKPQAPEGFHPDSCIYSETGWALWHDKGGCTCKPVSCNYNTGDILWVRETWADLRGMGFGVPFAYRADSLNRYGEEDGDSKRCRVDYGVKWRPSIHMPREAARLFLLVKSVRVERLQEITEDDASAEGAPILNPGVEVRRVDFAILWDNIYSKKCPWDSNPWVWVIEFERTGPATGQE